MVFSLKTWPIVGCLLAVPSFAFAQTVTLQSSNIKRFNADGSSNTATSTSGMNIFQRLNGADCVGVDDQGVSYDFPIVATGFTVGSQHLEVWAGGTDCGMLTARTGTSATCWPVLADQPQPVTQGQTLRVRAQDIVSQIAASTKNLTYSKAGSAVCTSVTGEASVTLYFMLVDTTNNLVGTSASWKMNVKLVGPAAPTSVTADGSANAILAKWVKPSDATLTGYYLYVDTGATMSDAGTTSDASGTIVWTCNDAGLDDAGMPVTDDAGVPIDAGCTSTTVYDAGSSGGTCSSTTLVAGASAIKLTPSGSAGAADTSATIKNLTNGQAYAVAIAARDKYDNTGPLSAPACATPEPIIDFWSQYKNAGGQAGGFCSLEPNAPASPGIMAFGLGVTFVAWLRRRKARTK